ncbi:MAG TPA: D-alanine--D-alanine ligase [Myxococcales bacterium]|nr:D-alanine--D-alanine ligase [Myxococcales bacterium]
MGFNAEELKSKRVGVLMGGLSAEREVSLRTGSACAEALESKGYIVRRIDVQKDVAARLLEEGVEVAFIALHGRWGEDGCIQGLLESMFIPYTGSGVLASAAGMDKVFSKRVFVAHDIQTPACAVFENLEAFQAAPRLPFELPAVVKPSGEGSSVGVKIVKDAASLREAVAEASRLKGAILIERYVKGREIQVAVLDDEALGAIEILPANEFYDYAAKYQANTTRYLFPAPIPAAQEATACATALAAHRALGCGGATRSDLILDADGRCWLLEVNTLPGMTSASLLPKIAAGKGIDFPSLCERLLLGASLKG